MQCTEQPVGPVIGRCVVVIEWCEWRITKFIILSWYSTMTRRTVGRKYIRRTTRNRRSRGNRRSRRNRGKTHKRRGGFGLNDMRENVKNRWIGMNQPDAFKNKMDDWGVKNLFRKKQPEPPHEEFKIEHVGNPYLGGGLKRRRTRRRRRHR